MQATEVLERNLKAFDNFRFIINQGGSRSSKTISICQLVILKSLQIPNYNTSIIRKTMPALKGSIMRDFFGLMKDYELYNENNHNKTTNEYYFSNGSMVEFFSAADEQRLKGRSRNVAILNEADELSFGEFTQINIRTKDRVISDFNPSCPDDHWLWELMKKENATLIKSTYKDNPFLPKEQVDEIEYLINTDENYYKIYALGERPISNSRIFTHNKLYSNDLILPYVYGLDFGFNHPTALVRVYKGDRKIYAEEIIYKSGLTSSDLIAQMHHIEKNIPIYCDYARPEIIEDLKRAGFRALPANKNVQEGIDYIKLNELYVNVNSVNLNRELKLYSYKTKGETITDEPIKLHDDAIDALRYGAISFKKPIVKYSVA
jgi:phage terminase large subunit